MVEKDYLDHDGRFISGIFATRPEAEEAAVVVRKNSIAEVEVVEYELGLFEV